MYAYACAHTGATDSPEESAAITEVGRLAVVLPISVKLVKLLLLGRTFGVLPQCVIMAAGLSVADVFVYANPVFFR
jgi:HrpA-like RNA helicase